EAVLRRPRLVHHVGADARARRPGRIGDLGRARDDGGDESPRLPARHDPRRLRARALGEHRPRLGLEGERETRAGALLPGWAYLSTRGRTARAGSVRATTTRRATPSSSAAMSPAGACGICR